MAVIEDGRVVAVEQRESRTAASRALVEMTESLTPRLLGIDLFVADCGPGSFIGVRVAVTLAKSLAWAQGKPCASVTSFDLISPAETVAFPSKRGEYFVRTVGGAVQTQEGRPDGAVGFGPDFDTPVYPSPARAADLWDRLVPIEPALLLPSYVLEPSISTPKTPYAQA